MISPSDFRKGSTKILWNNEPWLVLDYQSTQPGKGGSYMRTKMKNMISGRVLEETFRSGEKFPEPDVTYSQMQYLYADDLYHFMDQETFEQFSFDKDQLGDCLDYLKESEIYKVVNFEQKPICVEPPLFMNLKIAETVPGVKGDTAQGGSKHATLETGLVVTVPLFLEEGDQVKVDTRDGKYIERVNS